MFLLHEVLCVARGLWSVQSFRHPCWQGPHQCPHLSSGSCQQTEIREKLQSCITCLYVWCLSGKSKSSTITHPHSINQNLITRLYHMETSSPLKKGKAIWWTASSTGHYIYMRCWAIIPMAQYLNIPNEQSTYFGVEMGRRHLNFEIRSTQIKMPVSIHLLSDFEEW